ncbi:MAG: maltose alpha-D-glucosyltransferase / alpha-amylase [Chloroflexota bacterium]|nr:maltose alpha-D-glucosyltransferase / alpha-amylase [Chloroflexota bacterium]
MLAVVALTLDDRSRQQYSFALTDSPLREAAPGDGVWRALAVAMGEGRTIPALTDDPTAPVRAALVCRPAPAFRDLVPGGAEQIARGTERDLGADQSNTSVVLDERLVLKAYRRLQPGLNPDLEMTAFLSEEAGFPAVPRLAGFAELVSARDGTTTIAMAQEYVADGADAFESLADTIAGWLAAPGELSVEFATEVAADLGTLTAGLHGALADGRGLPDMAPREATRDEIRSWAREARAHLDTALDVKTGEARASLRELAPKFAEALTVLDAVPTTPEVIRAHGDYHLGQLLLAPDGFRIVDFEGEPLQAPEVRRAHRSPLRDVASMLRSIDHVARSGRRRAEAANGGPLEHTGLDLDGWIRRARERFIEAYQASLRKERVWIDLDPALLRAFEIDKELYEFAYATTYLPSWLYAPIEGMRALFEDEA